VQLTIKQLFIPALVACTLLGCTMVDPIEMSGDPASVRPFSTYRIYEEQFVFATTLSEQERSQVSTALRKAAVDAFAERGYREGSDADVLVSLGAISRPTFEAEDSEGEGHIKFVDPSVVEAGRPTSTPASEPGPSGAGREGALFLYLVDPKTKRAIWRASTDGSASTPSEAIRKARATYSAMINKLPVAAGSVKP
jgi:hypothetical protein